MIAFSDRLNLKEEQGFLLLFLFFGPIRITRLMEV